MHASRGLNVLSSTQVLACAAAAVASLSAIAHGQVIAPPFATAYSLDDLGTPLAVPANFGGLTLKAGDPNTLLLGGAANGPTGAIYSVPLTRGCAGQITGFAGPATLFCSAPNIDGGLAYGPNNVLFFTTYSNNTIGQVKPGSVAPDKTINLTPLGVAGSTGTLMFVPPGFPGAGSLKILSYSGSRAYNASVVPDGSGTFNLANVQETAIIASGPEGLVYIEGGNPNFAVDSVLVSEYSTGKVAAYDVNPSGDPIPATRRDFITGLSGAEGAMIDPLTGDFLFSTFGGGNRIIVVRGFNACDADFIPLGGDGQINVSDLLGVISAWGQTCVPADINGSGTVDVSDLLAVIATWGPCP